MGGDEFTIWKELLKNLVVFFLYPLLGFFIKRFTVKSDKLEKTQQDHTIRLAVVETQVKTINDDIREIKDSIDKLPSRIKNDIKDIFNNGK